MQRLQASIHHPTFSRSWAEVLQRKRKKLLAVTKTKKKQCANRWKLRPLKSRLQPPKPRSANELNKTRAVKRKRRRIKDARKKSSSVSRRKKQKGRGKRMMRRIRCARGRSKKRGCRSR